MNRKTFLSQSANAGESTSAAFKLLDSSDIQAVQEFVENLRDFEKEPWLVDNLITYYLSSQSSKAAELIVKCRSEHDRLIFKRLHSAFEDTGTRKQTLKLLLCLVSKKPPWLHKIVKEQILPDIFKCLKLEKNVPVLMDAVYIITMLLPIVPDGMVKYFDDIFESLLRLMKLAFYNEDGTPEVYILHLNVGLYSLFARLYGMYPWHYLNSLQEYYIKNKITPDFYKSAIEPMLSTVKFNPGLITSTKESELRGEQWRKKETHDIVADCASLSLDVTESTKDYVSRCPVLITKEHDQLVKSAMNLPQDRKEIDVEPDNKMNTELAAPIELAKDSLVSVAANSSTFFSPSDRLGLSTPPPGDPITPGAMSSGQAHFNFATPTNKETSQHDAAQTKTPHNTNHNTPNQFTPKNTPTTPMNGSESVASASRSRHTSGTKLSLSRLSIDEPIPPSPLRKEFTSEPPNDVPRIISMSSGTSTVNTSTLSVTNLPHLLEKISDTGSAHGTDNDSEDEEVESINTLTDNLTTKSVAEFMKKVNRIRFISMTNTETDTDKGKTVKRSGSCPTFTEEMNESNEDVAESLERSSSIQTRSSNDLALSKSTSNDATPEPQQLSDIPLPGASSHLPGVKIVGLISAYDNPPQSSSAGLYQSISDAAPGAGSVLDRHIMLLNEELRLGSVVQSQLQQTNIMQTGAINWTHFGGSPPADEVSIARGQLLLLHTQLMYERQKRELHAERNRRLLSKIAKAEKVKQNNQTLQGQINRLKDDIFNLQTTIRLQNNEIHRLRDEKTRSDAGRERDQTALIKDNEGLKYSNEEIQRAFDARTEELKVKSKALAESIGKVERLEQDLHMTMLERTKYSRFEDEVCRMKKELLLMGEMQVKYEEKIAALKYDNQMPLLLPEQETIYQKDIAKLEDKLQKKTEHCQIKQNQIDALSARIKEQDTVISEQGKEMEMVRGEHKCRIQAIDDKYSMSEQARQALQIQMLSLHDQIGRLADVPARRNTAPEPTNGL